MSTDADIDPRMTPAIVHRILVVEDDAETAAFLKTFLEREKYEVTIARDGGQAHSMFVMKKPDFVILDLILPGETGFEVCERLKTLERFVPVLIQKVIWQVSGPMLFAQQAYFSSRASRQMLSRSNRVGWPPFSSASTSARRW